MAADAEQLRLAVALERTRTLTDVAGQFDLQVRCVVGSVAQATKLEVEAGAFIARVRAV